VEPAVTKKNRKNNENKSEGSRSKLQRKAAKK
jgi:hypothetical protein